MEPQTIMHRNITCACSSCVVSNYDSCLTNSTWTTKTLEKERPEVQASENRARTNIEVDSRFDNNAIETEERAAQRFVVSDMNATWQARREQEYFLGQARGKR